MKTIDVHAHWFPPEWLALIEAEGAAEGAKVGVNRKGWKTLATPGAVLVQNFQPDMVDLETMMSEMEKAQIDLRVFSLTNPMVYWASPEFGLKMARAFNDACAAAHRKYPTRFLGTIMLPMQAPELAVQELERAAKLPGMCGVYMAMHINGKNLDQKEYWPVYEKIEAIGLPLCLHPVNPCGVERMRNFHLRNLVGNPHEAAIAAASLIFGGVLDDFPRLDVVLPHAGGSFPWLIGRFDNGVATRHELEHIKQPASAYLRRFHYDTISHSPQILRFLMAMVGSDRIVIGSDYNFDAGYPRPVEFVDGIPQLTRAEREQILVTNAEKLLRLKERFRQLYQERS
jgi:aminocarboxymuconate-semialdehyde decarboxylase